MKWRQLLLKHKPVNLMEIDMSAEILRPSVNRAVEAYKKLQAAHADAVATMLEQDARIAADAVIIAELKAILDGTFFEDTGGSTGGVVG